MIFLLKSAGLIALFLIVYRIFLAQDTYFKGIRFYFITGILASLIIPFISIIKYVEVPTQQFVYNQDFQNFISTNTVEPFDWTALLINIYFIGIFLSGLYFTFQIISLLKILNTKSVKKNNNYKIIETKKEVSPFSFFNYIVYNPTQFSKEEIQQLLKHEETHVLQRHSIDMLLAHTLTCVQWFNPFAWYFKKAITQNLEYIADKEAKFTITPKNYAYLLLKTTKPNYQIVLANNFYNSLLKKRIMMLHKNHSHSLKQLKLALILPLLVGFIFVFNTKVVAQHKQDTKSKITKVDIDAFAMQFEKNATKADLDNIKSSFKEKFGFDIKIKNLKRNDKNEITSIKITAKKGKTNTQYATSSNEPIQPIKIEYNGKSDQISISAGSDEHNKSRNFVSYEIKNFKGDPSDLIKLKKSFLDDKDENDSIFINSNNTIIHKLKGKNSFVFVSNKDKSKSNASLFTKQRGSISTTWIDDDGNKTDIIEVKEDGNVSKIIEIKKDKNGAVSKTVKVVEIPEDIEVVNFKTDGKPVKSKMSFKINKNDTIIKVKSNQINKKDTPIYFLNGKVITSDKFDNIDTNTIKSVSVIKGKATDKYGEKAKNGVILITTKKRGKNKPKKLKFMVERFGDNDDIDASEFNDKFVFNTKDGTPPLFVIDGKVIKDDSLKNINPNNIKSIIVLKGIKAIKKYGRKGRNGVVEIYTKKKVQK
jgi:bla regulator protein blaR1